MKDFAKELEMLGENPLVSVLAQGSSAKWTTRIKHMGHNVYQLALRESAGMALRIADSDEVRILLHDDLHGLIKALHARVRQLQQAKPGQVVFELALG